MRKIVTKRIDEEYELDVRRLVAPRGRVKARGKLLEVTVPDCEVGRTLDFLGLQK